MLSTHGLRFGLVRKELNQYIKSIHFTGVYAVMELGTIVAFIDKKSIIFLYVMLVFWTDMLSVATNKTLHFDIVKYKNLMKT